MDGRLIAIYKNMSHAYAWSKQLKQPFKFMHAVSLLMFWKDHNKDYKITDKTVKTYHNIWNSIFKC